MLLIDVVIRVLSSFIVLQVEEISDINRDTNKILDSGDNLEQDTNTSNVTAVDTRADKSSTRSPAAPSISVSKAVVKDSLSSNESNISTSDKPSKGISIRKEIAVSSSDRSNENIATPDNVGSEAIETTGSSEVLDKVISESNDCDIPESSSIKGTGSFYKKNIFSSLE